MNKEFLMHRIRESLEEGKYNLEGLKRCFFYKRDFSKRGYSTQGVLLNYII